MKQSQVKYRKCPKYSTLPFYRAPPFSSTTNDFYKQIYEMHSPLLGPISFIFMQFSEKNWPKTRISFIFMQFSKKNWPKTRLTPPPCALTPPTSGCSRCSQIMPSAKSWSCAHALYLGHLRYVPFVLL